MNTAPFRFAYLGPMILLATCVGIRADENEEQGYKFTTEVLKSQPTMSIRFRVTDPNLISDKYGEAFGKLFGHIMAEGGQIAGMPYGRYHSVSDDGIDIEAGFPVAKEVAGKGEIKAGELPGGKVVTTLHVGPYEELGKAHLAIQGWITKNDIKTNGGLWEIYLTDPGQEPDSSKWQTRLFQPIVAEDAPKPEQ